MNLIHLPPALPPPLPLAPAHLLRSDSSVSSRKSWLMVKFLRAVTSETMSLDLRRSSMCTDCHSPSNREQGISCPRASKISRPRPSNKQGWAPGSSSSHFQPESAS
uniref:Uncharacterized protein n=1 Tax=Crocodylus porosus TaxID=8502 RepID=A0A7M4FMP0_CROPO